MPKILGGPKREAFGKENVLPVNFADNDPFGDIASQFTALEKIIKDGNLTDIVILARRKIEDKFEVRAVWRGTSPFVYALGMIEYGKLLLYNDLED